MQCIKTLWKEKAREAVSKVGPVEHEAACNSHPHPPTLPFRIESLIMQIAVL